MSFGCNDKCPEGCHKIHLHQTPTATKKGIWHITSGNETSEFHGGVLRRVSALCNSGTYYNGGYNWNPHYHDVPPVPLADPPRAIFDGTQRLCASCARAAYESDMVRLVPND